ncbi:MAG: Rid family hydrolase [Candidatus Omnitrophica bacterium]|nr:Rid family hydrolase [Candidatus Omnitrophota bacterium]
MKKIILKKSISAPRFLNEPIEYNKSFSRGLSVYLGKIGLLFISGTASINNKGISLYAGDFASQTRRTFENISALLKSEGANWHDIVQTRCYLRDMRDYKVFNGIRNAFYKKQNLKPFPASVCIQANLCRAELLVEIEAIAIVKK